MRPFIMLAYSSAGFYIKENTGGHADEKSVTRHKKTRPKRSYAECSVWLVVIITQTRQLTCNAKQHGQTDPRYNSIY